MITDSIFHENLPIIDFELFSNKNFELTHFINNLKLHEVDTEEKFRNTLQLLKSFILLRPVTFEEPNIIDHVHTEKEIISTHRNFGRANKIPIYIITVEVKFTGSVELFKYKPNGYTFTSSITPLIFQPSGNSIIIQVEQPTFDDRNHIIQEAKNQMSLTYSFIQRNNAQAQQWNASIEPTLESKLRNQKEKLTQLYIKH